MGRPREHDDATATALLEAAERLVDEGGSDALAVRAVADAAGTTTRAVYSLFGSRAGLVQALRTRLFQLLEEAVARVPATDDPVADVVTASVDGFRRVALEHASLYRLVFLESTASTEQGPGHARQAGEAFGRLEQLVARVQAGRGLGGLTPAQAARAVHALTEGLATVELRGELGGPRQARQLWTSSVTALVEGFALPAPQRRRP